MKTIREFFQSKQGQAFGWLVAIFAFLVYTQLQLRPLLDDRGTGITGIGIHGNDFKHFYLGSRLLLDGIPPFAQEVMIPVAGDYSVTVDPRFRTINPYVYLPFTGLALAPFAIMPFAQAILAFLIFNQFLLIVALVGLLRYLEGRFNPYAIAGLMLLLAFNHPLLRQNLAGQLNIILMAGYVLVLVLDHRRAHPAMIGFLAAFLILFKLSPGILIFLWLAQRRWNLLVYTAIAGLAFTLLTVAITGLRAHLEFIAMMPDLGFGQSSWADPPASNTFWRDPFNVSINATLHRLFVEDPRGILTPVATIPHSAANVLTWMIALPLMGSFLWFARLDRSPDSRWAYGLAISTSLLLPSLFWDHYHVQLFVPALMLMILGHSANRALALLCVVVAGLNLPGNPEWARDGMAIAFQSAKLFPALILHGILVAEILKQRHY